MNKTKQSSIQAINSAISSLNAKGIKATQLSISKETNLSIRTIKRHWKDIQGDTSSIDRVTDKPKQGITKSDFERFKSYKPSGNIKIHPWDL